jgi:hypothetical protein
VEIMPNWVDVAVTIVGDKEKREKLIEKSSNLPPIIWSDDPEGVQYEEDTFGFQGLVPVPDEITEKGFNRTGYDWCLDNWGTKWNPKIIKLEEKDNNTVIVMYAAGEPPLEWFDKVSKKYPSLDFRLEYYGSGNQYAGRVLYKGGKRIEDLFELEDTEDFMEEYLDLIQYECL